MPDIEKATLWLVAIRESRNLSSPAAQLGMEHVSLWRWIRRHKLPMHGRAATLDAGALVSSPAWMSLGWSDRARLPWPSWE